MHQPAHSFSKPTVDSSAWEYLTAKVWGPPFPFCDGQWSYELNTAILPKLTIMHTVITALLHYSLILWDTAKQQE